MIGQFRRALLALTATIVGSSGHADPMVKLLGDVAEKRCFARAYDAAHLAKNPRQIVRMIRLDSVPYKTPLESAPADATKDKATAQHQRLKWTGIEMRLKGGNEKGIANLYCQPVDGRLACGVEGDGGSVSITAEPRGRIRLVVGRALQFETDRRFVDLKNSDDKIFVLAPLPAKDCLAPYPER